MRKEDQIYEEIRTAAGIDNGAIADMYVYFSVKEMRQKVGSSVWKTEPSGRFQINVSVPGDRDRIFRTKVKDGSYDLEAVLGAIRDQVRIRRAAMDREAARTANRDAAEEIRNEYKLTKTHVSAYASSANTFVAPSTVEGLINVQINFGAVSPEVARKIMEFAQSLEA